MTAVRVSVFPRVQARTRTQIPSLQSRRTISVVQTSRFGLTTAAPPGPRCRDWGAADLSASSCLSLCPQTRGLHWLPLPHREHHWTRTTMQLDTTQ